MTAYADIVRPSGRPYTLAYDILAVLAGSLFLALMSQLSIRLWFTPVPLTMQTFAVLLIGALLGSKRGALAVVAYLAEGALGLPVFASGAAGIATLVGPTGGYFVSWIATAFVIGLLLERGWKNSYVMTVVALVIGSAITLALGAAWLSMYVGVNNALAMGVYPFIVGDAVKLCAAAALIPTGWKLIK